MRHTERHGLNHCRRPGGRHRHRRRRTQPRAPGRAAAEPGACHRPHVPADLRDGGGLDRGRVRLQPLGGPDALRRRRLRALRPGLAALGPAGRPVGPAAHDAAVLLRHRRVGAAGGADAQRLGAGRGADAAGRLCLDLPPGGHPDAAAACAQPRGGHRHQRPGRQPGHRGGGAEHRLHGAVVRLACGLRAAGAAGHRLRAAVCARVPAGDRGTGQAHDQGARARWRRP